MRDIKVIWYLLWVTYHLSKDSAGFNRSTYVSL